jgi:hypothetical protein
VAAYVLPLSLALLVLMVVPGGVMMRLASWWAKARAERASNGATAAGRNESRVDAAPGRVLGSALKHPFNRGLQARRAREPP